jgi:hypothetical protein
MSATQSAVVDDLGNINVHGRSALQVVWKVKSAEGAFLNISASDLFIEIAGSIRVALTAGEDDYSRKLSLTRAQIAALPLNQPLSYALHDETPSSPATIWSGKITAYGFRAAPPGADAVEPGTASWTGATVTVMQGESVPTVVVTYMGATGAGVLPGGTDGQFLVKDGASDYSTEWVTITSADVSGLDAQLAALQSADADLAVIAALTPSNDDLLQRKAGAWANRTPAQVKTDLALVKGDVGLGNVDNTSDANKPVSTAQQAALDLKLNLAGGTMSGVLATIAGTAALPGLAVAGDLNTGIYGVSADVLGVSAGGSLVQSWGVGTSTLTGNLLRGADNTYDDGALGANRVRSYYAGTSFIAPLGAVGTPSYSFTGDANTGFWSPAADTLAWSTGGTERMRVTSTGLFGVGVTPTVRFHVANGLSGQSSANPDSKVIFESSTATAISILSPNANYGGFYFGDAATATAGGVVYTNSSFSGAVPANSLIFYQGAAERWMVSSGHFSPVADNTYDVGAAGANRIRSGYFGTNVVIGYSTTSSAQLHVGAGVNGTLYDGAGGAITPQVINSQTSGSASIGVVVNDGANNRRAGLFVDQTNGLWGLSARVSSGVIPFIIFNNAAEQLRLSTAGVLTLYNNLMAGADATYDLGASGANRFRDHYASRNVIAGTGVSAGTYLRVNGTNEGYIALGTADDVLLYRDAANTLAQRNGTNAQIFNVYNTYTDSSNFERFAIKAQSGNDVRLQTEKAGTGTARSLIFGTDANVRWLIGATSGDFLAGADNTYDIGASGATRPRIAYIGTRVVAPTVTTTATTVAGLPAAATAGAGGRAFVTDATATTFLSIVAGGGANAVPVVSNGTNWLIG